MSYRDRIRRANLNGTSVETLCTIEQGGASGITLDVDNEMMYLTTSVIYSAKRSQWRQCLDFNSSWSYPRK